MSNDSKFNYVNYYSCALIHYIKSHLYGIINNAVEFNYKIEGLENNELIRIDRKLVTLEKEKYIKDYQTKENVKEFAQIVCEKTDIDNMDVILDCSFRWKSYYANVSSIWIYLSEYINGEVKTEE